MKCCIVVFLMSVLLLVEWSSFAAHVGSMQLGGLGHGFIAFDFGGAFCRWHIHFNSDFVYFMPCLGPWLGRLGSSSL